MDDDVHDRGRAADDLGLDLGRERVGVAQAESGVEADREQGDDAVAAPSRACAAARGGRPVSSRTTSVITARSSTASSSAPSRTTESGSMCVWTSESSGAAARIAASTSRRHGVRLLERQRRRELEVQRQLRPAVDGHQPHVVDLAHVADAGAPRR